MSELVSDYVNYAERRGERIEKVVEIYDLADAGRSKEDTEATCVKKSLRTEHTAGCTAGGRCHTLTAVCVLLLCVLLLTAVTVLWIKFTNLNTENNQLQTRNTNLNTERDQLQTSYNDMRNERNQLKFQRDLLLFQRDQLLFHRDQLQQEASGLKNALLKLGWRFFSSSIYYIFTEKKYWDESRKYCTDRGADLVIINSTEEQEFISNYTGGTEAWIGLTDREREREFKWVDGKPLTTAFWWDGEPNDYNNEDCVITGYKNAKSNISTWADYPCNHPVVGICEMKIFN
ncbi:CD209 antigen-like [Pangasianodon hypophthalmus]|uniref:CD209 antigen-like n=1 Tax=Pangasianodon hypophthalmus TaxID=310915 RepID=UPI0023080E34|nr:CD209 antigen-like [Pangasianodon hypophthalmus]